MDKSAVESTRQRFNSLAGSFPEKVPLCPVTISKDVTDGVVCERVVFSTDASSVVPAYFAYPQSSPGASPAVVAIHPHNERYDGGKSIVMGKSEPYDCCYGLELAKRGYAVIAIDMLCFGERRPPVDVRDRRPNLANGAYERLEFAKALLEGSSAYARNIFDLQRAVDYLTTRPEAVAQRIGVIGHGLGGSLALSLALHDPRLKACVCSGGACMISHLLRNDISPDFGGLVPGMLSVGDMDLLVTCLIPRPVMLVSGVKDPRQPVEGFRQTASECAGHYQEHGIPDRFKAVEHEGGGEFPDECRQSAYDWLDKWLK